MPLPTVSGSLGACAKRTSIVDDSSAIVVFTRCLRMRSLVSQLWHDAHTQYVCSAGKHDGDCCGNEQHCGMLRPFRFVFLTRSMKRHVCFMQCLRY